MLHLKENLTSLSHSGIEVGSGVSGFLAVIYGAKAKWRIVFLPQTLVCDVGHFFPYYTSFLVGNYDNEIRILLSQMLSQQESVSFTVIVRTDQRVTELEGTALLFLLEDITVLQVKVPV